MKKFLVLCTFENRKLGEIWQMGIQWETGRFSVGHLGKQWNRRSLYDFACEYPTLFRLPPRLFRYVLRSLVSLCPVHQIKNKTTTYGTFIYR